MGILHQYIRYDVEQESLSWRCPGAFKKCRNATFRCRLDITLRTYMGVVSKKIFRVCTVKYGNAACHWILRSAWMFVVHKALLPDNNSVSRTTTCLLKTIHELGIRYWDESHGSVPCIKSLTRISKCCLNGLFDSNNNLQLRCVPPRIALWLSTSHFHTRFRQSEHGECSKASNGTTKQ